MPYRLRHFEVDSKMCQEASLEIVTQVYPQEMIAALLTHYGAWEERERSLNMVVTVHLLLAAALWTRLSLPRVLEQMARPLHLLGLPLPAMQVEAGAISYRREQLGAQPLQTLFEQCCRPLCTPATIGAYRFGKHLMALDGTMQDLPDSAANAQAFVRPSNQSGPGPFPQARLLLLMECASHAIVDAAIGDRSTAESTLAQQLLLSLTRDMLLLHDAQFTGLSFWQKVRRTGAHVLAPVPAHHLSSYRCQLRDGSYLATYHPTPAQERAGIKPLVVRVIDYHITDERLGEPAKCYRLATTLLNPRVAPVLDLIECYHERWEIELCIDEIKTHQRLQQSVLRSRTPEGVYQELYAILLAHYAVRFHIHQAACQAGVDPDRISFTDAVFVLSETTRDLTQVHPERYAPFLHEMYERLTAKLLPERRLRANPRVLKKLYRKYKRKPNDAPSVPPFNPQDRFLDFVVLLI